MLSTCMIYHWTNTPKHVSRCSHHWLMWIITFQVKLNQVSLRQGDLLATQLNMKEYLLYSYTLTFIIDANFLLKKISRFPGEAYNIILTRGGGSGIGFNKLQRSTEKKAVTMNYTLSN